VLTRISRRTKAGPQPCAAAWLPGLDSNQQGQGSGPCWDARVPPGIEYAGRDSNPQTTRFELASFAG
jgi:hypothetical protein